MWSIPFNSQIESLLWKWHEMTAIIQRTEGLEAPVISSVNVRKAETSSDDWHFRGKKRSCEEWSGWWKPPRKRQENSDISQRRGCWCGRKWRKDLKIRVVSCVCGPPHSCWTSCSIAISAPQNGEKDQTKQSFSLGQVESSCCPTCIAQVEVQSTVPWHFGHWKAVNLSSLRLWLFAKIRMEHSSCGDMSCGCFKLVDPPWSVCCKALQLSCSIWRRHATAKDDSGEASQPHLSENCWLLLADASGEQTQLDEVKTTDQGNANADMDRWAGGAKTLMDLDVWKPWVPQYMSKNHIEIPQAQRCLP